MLNKRAWNFNDLVWEAAAAVGLSPAKITDRVIAKVFPNTKAAAEEEGADTMLRNGVYEAVRALIKKQPDPNEQIDFSSIDPSYQSVVRKLKNLTYTVESLGIRVPVARLIEEPELLDDARKFMRRKGEECLAEATTLDELYAAVTAPQPEAAA